MRKFATGLFVVVVAVFAGLVLAEILVRNLFPQAMSTSFRVDTDTGLSILRGDGNARHQVAGHTQTYNFYRPYLRDTQRNPDRENILVLGESWTFGWLLPARDTYVARLQAFSDKAFPGKFNLMNAAVPGMGTAEQAAFLDEKAQESAPDRVLIFLNVHDADRAEKSPQFSWDPTTGNLERRTHPPSRLKRFLNNTPGYNWLLANSHLVQLARECMAFACGRPAPIRFVWADEASQIDPDLDLGKTKALYARIRDWSKKHQIPVMVITTGWPQPLSSPRTYLFHKQADSFFKSLGMDFCDSRPAVEPVLRKDMGSYEIPDDFHPNSAGAKVIAEGVWSKCLGSRLASYAQNDHSRR